MKKKASLSAKQFDVIDWKALLEKCLSRLSRIHQLTYCKLLHGILNIIEQINKFYGKPTLFPHCLLFLETTQHIFHCPHLETVKLHEQQSTLLKTKLEKLRTSPPLLDSIKRGITSGPPSPF
jgi:hypothetical protein